jgi:FAD/FMN-containing dehydrogenase
MITEHVLDEINGRVIRPDDDDYDAIRQVVMGNVDRHPGAIVRVADAADAARAILAARESGAELAVRSGGHSGAGHSSTEGGILIDVRDLRELEIDPVARTVTAQAGLTAMDLAVATAEHGLAIGFGDTGTVGIGGITLGGGIGYLSRRDGLTIDNLLAAQIVTADGEIIETDADHHPDLFWAIRGGGGNFGVATRFTYRLSQLGRMFGGMLVLPATPDTIAGFMSAAAEAPDELSAIVNVMSCPPMPFIDQAYHGRPVILATIAWSGDLAEGERRVAPFRSLAPALADQLAEIGYPDLFPAEEGGEDYHPLAESVTMFTDHIGPAEGASIVAAIEASDAPMRVAQLRPMGGAIARVAPDATAFAHRDKHVMVNVASFYIGPEDRAMRRAWVDDLAAALDQGVSGAYVNFVNDEGPGSVLAAYPEATLRRLASVKATYDPTNLFRRCHNVAPAS